MRIVVEVEITHLLLNAEWPYTTAIGHKKAAKVGLQPGTAPGEYRLQVRSVGVYNSSQNLLLRLGPAN